jgi:hypothetical protein
MNTQYIIPPISQHDVVPIAQTLKCVTHQYIIPSISRHDVMSIAQTLKCVTHHGPAHKKLTKRQLHKDKSGWEWGAERRR